MKKLTLDDIRGIAEQATDGPWEYRPGDPDEGEPAEVIQAPRTLAQRYMRAAVAEMGQDGDRGEADAQMIAASVNYVRDLLESGKTVSPEHTEIDIDVAQWISKCINNVGGFLDYEKYELPVWHCSREEAVACFIVRALANPDCAGSAEVLAAITKRRSKAKDAAAGISTEFEDGE